MVALNENARENPRTLLEAMRHCDEGTARKFIEGIKWPEGPCCPECGSVNIGTIKSRGRYQCRERQCRRQFGLMTGTIMEASHLRLEQWCAAVWMLVNCKNGVSSCEIARTIGCKQQSAWHLLHRVRHLLKQDTAAQFGARSGAVEVDSTFIGGLLKFMTYERQQRALKRGNWGKTTVHAAKDRRTGLVTADILDADIDQPSKDFIVENIEYGATIYTDKGSEYKWLSRRGSVYGHESVNHKEREYVRGDVHTNGLESFFNCLRRGLKGTYIAASPEHLQAYVDEQVWRFNHRTATDWRRFEAVMQLIVGKRLTYSSLTDGAIR